MKKFYLFFVLAALIAFGQTAQAESPYSAVWKIAHNETERGSDHFFALKFKNLVEQKSGGNIKVDIFPLGTLGDGSANLETGLDLNLIGNVNVRALNIFLSAVQGVISSGTAAAVDTKTIISGLLGNVVKGYSSKEFRDVQFTVRGKPGQFYFGGFAIAPNLKQNFRPDALNDPKNSTQIREQKFMLNIEIPVGSSSDKRKSESVKDQVKGQVLLQAIQGLLNGVSFGD